MPTRKEKVKQLPFNDRLDDLHVRMFKKDLDEMRAYARSHGLTLTALVRAMFHRIVQDKFQSAPPVLPE